MILCLGLEHPLTLFIPFNKENVCKLLDIGVKTDKISVQQFLSSIKQLPSSLSINTRRNLKTQLRQIPYVVKFRHVNTKQDLQLLQGRNPNLNLKLN